MLRAVRNFCHKSGLLYFSSFEFGCVYVTDTEFDKIMYLWHSISQWQCQWLYAVPVFCSVQWLWATRARAGAEPEPEQRERQTAEPIDSHRYSHACRVVVCRHRSTVALTDTFAYLVTTWVFNIAVITMSMSMSMTMSMSIRYTTTLMNNVIGLTLVSLRL